MDTRTGVIYETKDKAIEAGVPENRLITGTEEALKYIQPKILTRNQAKALRRKIKGK